MVSQAGYIYCKPATHQIVFRLADIRFMETGVIATTDYKWGYHWQTRKIKFHGWNNELFIPGLPR